MVGTTAARQIGAGIARAPLACFAAALMELRRRLTVSA